MVGASMSWMDCRRRDESWGDANMVGGVWGASGTVQRCYFFATTLAADVFQPRPSQFRLGGLPLARVYIVFPVDASTCPGDMSCSFSP